MNSALLRIAARVVGGTRREPGEVRSASAARRRLMAPSAVAHDEPFERASASGLESPQAVRDRPRPDGHAAKGGGEAWSGGSSTGTAGRAGGPQEAIKQGRGGPSLLPQAQDARTAPQGRERLLARRVPAAGVTVGRGRTFDASSPSGAGAGLAEPSQLGRSPETAASEAAAPGTSSSVPHRTDSADAPSRSAEALARGASMPRGLRRSASDRAAAPSAPTINVSIGRVELRLTQPVTGAPRRSPGSSPLADPRRTTLDDLLARRAKAPSEGTP